MLGSDGALKAADAGLDAGHATGKDGQAGIEVVLAGLAFAIIFDEGDALSGPAIIAAGVAVGQHIAACHARGVELRAAIAAAMTIDDARAIDIDTDWPS